MQKFKAWLYKTDDEGVSNLDTITTVVLLTIVWVFVIASILR